RLLELRKQLRNDPFPLPAVLPHLAAALLPLEDDVSVAAAFEELCLVVPRQLVPGRFHVDAERLRDALEDVLAPPSHSFVRPNQRNRSVIEAEVRVGDNQIGVEGVFGTETVAFRAHSVRTVEAEQLRRRRLVADVAMRAGVVSGK